MLYATPSSTTLAIALPNIVAFTSVVVAAIAIHMNRRMAQSALGHQIKLAHDERIWEQRSGVYIELLVWMDEWDTKLSWVTAEPSSLDLSGEQIDSDRERQAKVTAFASGEIRELVSRWRMSTASFATALHHLYSAKKNLDERELEPEEVSQELLVKAAEFNKTVEPILHESETVTNRIRDLIRSELQSGLP